MQMNLGAIGLNNSSNTLIICLPPFKTPLKEVNKTLQSVFNTHELSPC